jgi:hypothetical protein
VQVSFPSGTSIITVGTALHHQSTSVFVPSPGFALWKAGERAQEGFPVDDRVKVVVLGTGQMGSGIIKLLLQKSGVDLVGV